MLRKKLRAHSIIADFKDALYKTQKRETGWLSSDQMGYEAQGGEKPYQVKFVPGKQLSTCVRTSQIPLLLGFSLKIFGLGVIDCIQLTSYSFLTNNELQVSLNSNQACWFEFTSVSCQVKSLVFFTISSSKIQYCL